MNEWKKKISSRGSGSGTVQFDLNRKVEEEEAAAKERDGDTSGLIQFNFEVVVIICFISKYDKNFSWLFKMKIKQILLDLVLLLLCCVVFILILFSFKLIKIWYACVANKKKFATKDSFVSHFCPTIRLGLFRIETRHDTIHESLHILLNIS